VSDKSKNDWEYKRTTPWHDEQMCVVNGIRRQYVGEWGDDALVCFHGHPKREGGMATVRALRLRPDRYELGAPTMPRTYN